MEKLAVITVTIGEKYGALAKVTHPTMRSYAERIGADFVVIDDLPPALKEQGFTPYFAKLSLPEYFKTYHRMIFIDTDCIVRPDCPNLFDLVPPHRVGIFKEGEFIPRRVHDLEMAARTYKTQIRMDPSEWRGEYYNTGVMVVSRIHKTIFKPIDLNQIDIQHGWDYGEQGWINIQLLNSSTPIEELEYRYNRMTVMDEKTGEDRHASYIIHYAGAPEQLSDPSTGQPMTLPEFIDRDLRIWQEASPDYSFPRHLLVWCGGGMGDQVDSEPVLRYIKEKAYPGSEIRVVTDWPRLFRHLGDSNFVIGRKETIGLQPDTPYYKMETLPGPEKSEMWRMVAHTMCHSTDFSSMSCLRRILPAEEKQIKLEVDPDDVNRLIDLTGLGEGELLKSVIIHAGRNWPSKTFPREWWQSIIDELCARKIRTILVGKEVSEEQGYVDIEPRDTSVDLRDKTDVGLLLAVISKCGVCLSNDSGPIHIAGAFDNFIVAIPSCKHPEHILPFRHGSQSYKSVALYRALTCDRIDSNPTQVHGQTIDWVEGDISDYLPEIAEVVETVSDLLSQVEKDTRQLSPGTRPGACN